MLTSLPMNYVQVIVNPFSLKQKFISINIFLLSSESTRSPPTTHVKISNSSVYLETVSFKLVITSVKEAEK